MKHLKITLLLFIGIIVSSCNVDFNINQVQGNGNVVTKQRSVSRDFNGVKGASGIDVYLTQGDRNEIVVEADENLHELIETEVENGMLKIRSNKNIGRAKAKKVHVTYTSINHIKASSGADVIGNSLIKGEHITLDSSSGADLEVEVSAKELYAESSSGSDLKITGQTLTLMANASSGSNINARQLKAINCKAKASSGADITVHVKEQLEGKASSGGDIKYYGNPTAVSSKDGYSGSVRKM